MMGWSSRFRSKIVTARMVLFDLTGVKEPSHRVNAELV